jgi:hypothetical protein
MEWDCHFNLLKPIWMRKKVFELMRMRERSDWAKKELVA